MNRQLSFERESWCRCFPLSSQFILFLFMGKVHSDFQWNLLALLLEIIDNNSSVFPDMRALTGNVIRETESVIRERAFAGVFSFRFVMPCRFFSEKNIWHYTWSISQHLDSKWIWNLYLFVNIWRMNFRFGSIAFDDLAAVEIAQVGKAFSFATAFKLCAMCLGQLSSSGCSCKSLFGTADTLVEKFWEFLFS